MSFSSANWTNADDSRNYLPIIWQVSQEPRFRHARTPRCRRAEAIRAPAPAMPARGATGVCTPPAAVFLPRRNASRWKRFLRAGRPSRHLRSFPFQRTKNPRAVKSFEAFAHKRLPADGKSARREVPLHDANAGGQTASAANAQPAPAAPIRGTRGNGQAVFLKQSAMASTTPTMKIRAERTAP